MLLFLLLFLLLILEIRKINQDNRRIIIISFIFGFFLILLQVLFLYYKENIWFAGSDATFYFEKGTLLLNFLRNGNNLVDALGKIRESKKYWGFITFNYLSMLPYFGMGFTSFILKMNYLIIYLLFTINLLVIMEDYKISLFKGKKNIVLFMAYLINIYWIVLINFRDGIIGIILASICLQFISKKCFFKKVLEVILLFILLILFRGEMIYIVLLSLILSYVFVNIKKVKLKLLLLTLFIITSFSIWYIIPLPKILAPFIVYSELGAPIHTKHSYEESLYVSVNNLPLAGKFFVERYIKGMIYALVHHNPFKYLLVTLLGGRIGNWILTPIHGVITILYGITIYFIAMPSFFTLIFSKNIDLYFNKNNFLYFFYMIFGVILLTYGIYAVALGVQERVQITTTIPFFISLIFIKRFTKKDKFIFLQICFIYFVGGLIYIIFRPPNIMN